MTLVDTEIVKKTELGDGRAVLTVKKTNPHAIYQFRTFAISGSSRFALRLSDHTCAASALHAHDVLARQFGAKESA